MNTIRFKYTDQELIALCRFDKDMYWNHFELRFKDYVRNIARSRCRTLEDAEDVTQESFLKIYDKFETFREGASKINGWIYRIVYNCAVDHSRKNRTVYELHDRLADQRGVHNICPEKKMLDKADLRELEEYLAKLSDIDRNILYRKAHGECARAIARDYQRSTNAVYLVVHRARKKLKKVAAYLLGD